MFIKSKKQEEPIINLDRVCSIRREGNDIRFYYSHRGDGFDFDYWEYDSKSARDEHFEKIVNVFNDTRLLIL